jgi:hypothetical protein
MDASRRILAFGGVGIALALLLTPSPMAIQADGQALQSSSTSPLTTDQIASLLARLAENQHHNDRALEEFERVERVISRKDGESSEAVSEHTDRVLPSGTGIMRLAMTQGGSPVSPQAYRRELQGAIDSLELAIHPNDRYRQDMVKFEKRRRDRAELVDAAAKAFRVTWAGRETRDSRTLTKLLFTPDPNYKAPNRATSFFEHVRATLWVDESAAQLVRAEAEITSDISFGGGIVARVYHGGHLSLEQSEVAPDIWLPSLNVYDVDGRKFLFGFGVHERTEITKYRRVGAPAEAIELLRSELNSLVAGTPSN